MSFESKNQCKILQGVKTLDANLETIVRKPSRGALCIPHNLLRDHTKPGLSMVQKHYKNIMNSDKVQRNLHETPVLPTRYQKTRILPVL